MIQLEGKLMYLLNDSWNNGLISVFIVSIFMEIWYLKNESKIWIEIADNRNVDIIIASLFE